MQRFLATVDQASDLVHLTSFGYTFEGRSLPLAVVGRVPDATPATVRASGRLRVYLQANIHAGEVEGKEAVLALIRDIAAGAHADWLQSMVLLVNPIYNADGNERVTLTSRGFQHGPIGGQGTRANAQGLNINRDNIKLETPEARSMVRLLNDFDPHVMIDLHTTNGSRHAYQLTYETPNNPAVAPAVVTETRAWLAKVVQAAKAKDGWDFHSYGNVSGQAPDRVWTTVEDLPRYTHNYWGLRNRFGILSETYSYLPFAERVTNNRRFLEEVLGYAHTNAARLREIAASADTTSLVGQRLSLASKVARGGKIEILMGDVEEEVNPYSGRIMHKRLDVRKPEPMWDETTFASTDSERVPAAYIVPASEKAVLERLRAHGVKLEPTGERRRSGGRGVPRGGDVGHRARVRESPGAHRHRRVGAGGAAGSCGCLAGADDAAAGAAGVLPAGATIERRRGHLERRRRGDQGIALSDPAHPELRPPRRSAL